MANTANGMLRIKPCSLELCEDLRRKIHEGGNDFNYEYEANVDLTEEIIEIDFTGRWTCHGAWDFFEGLMNDADYIFNSDLVATQMKGRGYANGTGYREIILKRKGAKKFHGRDTPLEKLK